MNDLQYYLTWDNAKKALALLVALAVSIALYFTVPGGLYASLAAQLLAVAVVGAGGKKLSRFAISLVVFATAGVVAYFQVDGAFPAFPDFGGDVAEYAEAVFGWLQTFAVYATPIVGAAMIQYNLILESVLKSLGGAVGLRLEPK